MYIPDSIPDSNFIDWTIDDSREGYRTGDSKKSAFDSRTLNVLQQNADKTLFYAYGCVLDGQNVRKCDDNKNPIQTFERVNKEILNTFGFQEVTNRIYTTKSLMKLYPSFSVVERNHFNSPALQKF